MNTTTAYKTAVVSLGAQKNKKAVYFNLQDLCYLSHIFYKIQNQLVKYTEAMANVMNYVLSAISSTTYIDPPANENKNILYYQLFEELKTIV